MEFHCNLEKSVKVVILSCILLRLASSAPSGTIFPDTGKIVEPSQPGTEKKSDKLPPFVKSLRREIDPKVFTRVEGRGFSLEPEVRVPYPSTVSLLNNGECVEVTYSDLLPYLMPHQVQHLMSAEIVFPVNMVALKDLGNKTVLRITDSSRSGISYEAVVSLDEMSVSKQLWVFSGHEAYLGVNVATFLSSFLMARQPVFRITICDASVDKLFDLRKLFTIEPEEKDLVLLTFIAMNRPMMNKPGSDEVHIRNTRQSHHPLMPPPNNMNVIEEETKDGGLCRMYKWYVTYDEVGWNYIQDPPGHWVNYCGGKNACPIPVREEKVNMTNNSYLAGYYLSMKGFTNPKNTPPGEPEVHCVPRTYTDHVIAFKEMHNGLVPAETALTKRLAVESCGCA